MNLKLQAIYLALADWGDAHPIVKHALQGLFYGGLAAAAPVLLHQIETPGGPLDLRTVEAAFCAGVLLALDKQARIWLASWTSPDVPPAPHG